MNPFPYLPCSKPCATELSWPHVKSVLTNGEYVGKPHLAGDQDGPKNLEKPKETLKIRRLRDWSKSLKHTAEF